MLASKVLRFSCSPQAWKRHVVQELLRIKSTLRLDVSGGKDAGHTRTNASTKGKSTIFRRYGTPPAQSVSRVTVSVSIPRPAALRGSEVISVSENKGRETGGDTPGRLRPNGVRTPSTASSVSWGSPTSTGDKDKARVPSRNGQLEADISGATMRLDVVREDKEACPGGLARGVTLSHGRGGRDGTDVSARADSTAGELLTWYSNEEVKTHRTVRSLAILSKWNWPIHPKHHRMFRHSNDECLCCRTGQRFCVEELFSVSATSYLRRVSKSHHERKTHIGSIRET